MTVQFPRGVERSLASPMTIGGFHIFRLGIDRWEVSDREGKRRCIRSTYYWARHEACRLAEEEAEEGDGLAA